MRRRCALCSNHAAATHSRSRGPPPAAVRAAALAFLLALGRRPFRGAPATSPPGAARTLPSGFDAVSVEAVSPHANPSAAAAVLFPRRSRLTWVNGIGHLPEHMSDPTDTISSAFGDVPVEYCHNPTSMTSESDVYGFVSDSIQASTHKLGRHTPEVDALVKHLRVALSEVGRRGRVVHIAHSQGSVITYLAARRLEPRELERIEVISFGGAATIRSDEFPELARCVNYYAVGDPILNVVPSAVRALKSGFYCGAAVDDEPDIVFLASRTGDPVTDHGLLNPTYLEALAWEGRRYRSLYLSSARGVMDGGSAFVGPLVASARWFPDFAYDVTRRLMLVLLALFMILRDAAREVVAWIFQKSGGGEKQHYEPIPSPSLSSSVAA